MHGTWMRMNIEQLYSVAHLKKAHVISTNATYSGRESAIFIKKAPLARAQALREGKISDMTTVRVCARFVIYEQTARLWATFKFVAL